MHTYPILKVESEANQRLTHMPLALRMKLDLSCAKISLDHWQALDLEARRRLLSLAAESEEEINRFKQTLDEALTHAGLPAAKTVVTDTRCWKERGALPEDIEAILDREGITLNWAELGRFERYVVCHFARRNAFTELRRATLEIHA